MGPKDRPLIGLTLDLGLRGWGYGPNFNPISDDTFIDKVGRLVKTYDYPK